MSVSAFIFAIQLEKGLFAGTHLYTCVERGTVRVEYVAQEQNTMFPARGTFLEALVNYRAR